MSGYGPELEAPRTAPPSPGRCEQRHERGRKVLNGDRSIRSQGGITAHGNGSPQEHGSRQVRNTPHQQPGARSVNSPRRRGSSGC